MAFCAPKRDREWITITVRILPAILWQERVAGCQTTFTLTPGSWKVSFHFANRWNNIWLSKLLRGNFLWVCHIFIIVWWPISSRFFACEGSEHKWVWKGCLKYDNTLGTNVFENRYISAFSLDIDKEDKNVFKKLCNPFKIFVQHIFYVFIYLLNKLNPSAVFVNSRMCLPILLRFNKSRNKIHKQDRICSDHEKVWSRNIVCRISVQDIMKLPISR